MGGNDRNTEKRLAAAAALDYVKAGMTLGLGTGSTSEYMLRGLGAMVAKGLKITGVPSSDATAALAKELEIPLTTLEDCGTLDLTIDGADEFDPKLRLIKGGGGALLREKILAYNSKKNIIIADSSKSVSKLGAFPLPLEIIPFALQPIVNQLEKWNLHPVLRHHNGSMFWTDEHNCIVDINILGQDNVEALNDELLRIPGVVETGLFLNTTSVLIMGEGDGTRLFKR